MFSSFFTDQGWLVLFILGSDHTTMGGPWPGEKGKARAETVAKYCNKYMRPKVQS